MKETAEHLLERMMTYAERRIVDLNREIESKATAKRGEADRIIGERSVYAEIYRMVAEWQKDNAPDAARER